MFNDHVAQHFCPSCGPSGLGQTVAESIETVEPMIASFPLRSLQKERLRNFIRAWIHRSDTSAVPCRAKIARHAARCMSFKSCGRLQFIAHGDGDDLDIIVPFDLLELTRLSLLVEDKCPNGHALTESVLPPPPALASATSGAATFAPITFKTTEEGTSVRSNA
eukprot:3150985-Amphidinium_carterae.1